VAVNASEIAMHGSPKEAWEAVWLLEKGSTAHHRPPQELHFQDPNTGNIATMPEAKLDILHTWYERIRSWVYRLNCWTICRECDCRKHVCTGRRHQGGGKPVHIKMTLFGLYLIRYQPHLSIFESFWFHEESKIW
jgi:hypothetical protein